MSLSTLAMTDLLASEGIAWEERASMVLLDEASLLKAIDVLVDRNVRIFGLEGFHRSGASLVPDLSMIVDASAERSVANAAAFIRSVVHESRDSERLYELVTEPITGIGLHVSAAGMLEGFPHHDGRVLGVRCAGGHAIVRIRSFDGEVTDLVCRYLKVLQCDDEPVDAIVGYIFVRRFADLPDRQQTRLRDTCAEVFDDDILVTIESVMDADITLVCKELVACRVAPMRPDPENDPAIG